jgi:hypothetical protein
MQFFLFDLALAFAALLGYRALEAAVRPRTPVISLDSRAPLLAGVAPRLDREIAARRASPPDSMLGQPPRQCEPGRAPPHRLINFW